MITKIKKKLYILFFTVYTLAISQPGGGGGLEIRNFKNTQGNVIQSDNLNYELYKFKENKLFSKVSGSGYLFLSSIYIPPFNNYSDRDDNEFYRLILVVSKDSMVVDFKDILSENGGGVTDVMDTLTFRKGYFKNLNAKTSQKIDAAFLLPNKLTAIYNLNQAKERENIELKKKYLQEAELDSLDGTFDNYLYHKILFSLASKDDDFKNSLSLVDKLIKYSKIKVANREIIPHELKSIFFHKINLLKKHNRHQDVVKTYDSLFNFSKNEQHQLEKYIYSYTFLKDNETLQDDLIKFKKKLFNTYNNEDYPYLINEIHFLQGQLSYRLKNEKKAKQYWEAAIALGHQFMPNQLDNLIVYFEDIKRHKPQDYFYKIVLANLYSFKSNDFFHYQKDIYNQYSNTVITLLKEVEDSDYKSYDCSLLVANTYFYLKEKKLAEQYLKKAIAIDSNRRSAYQLQYQMDRNLKKRERKTMHMPKENWKIKVLME